MPLMMQVKAKRAVECFVYMVICIERGENMHICNKYVLYKVKIYIYASIHKSICMCNQFI